MRKTERFRAFELMLAWLQLVRMPNHFTALADVLAGLLFVGGEYSSVPLIVSLVASSWLLYAAGMVLNDVFDVERDAAERPFRPIPSGRIKLRTAATVGWGLLVAGVLASGLASAISGDARSLIVGAVLALLIVLYDGVVKQTLIAPVVMGACRTANLMLGMTAASTQATGWWGFETAGFVAATALGIYVTGVTVFARNEVKPEGRSHLWLGLLIIAGGLLLFGGIDRFEPFSSGQRRMQFANAMVWPLLVCLIGFSILRRGVAAALTGDPAVIGGAIKLMILSIIVFDAALALAVANWTSALIVLSLLVPAVLLGKQVYST